jgi:acetyl-CoA carboxylase carboxyl transferase subunit alpha
MSEIILDFEKPIEQMSARQAELEAALSSNPEIASELKELKTQIEETKAAIYSNLTAWQRVQLARHPARPYTLDYLERIFTDFVEMHGDRRFADDPAIVGGFAKLDGKPVMVIGTQKGRNTKENVFRNFGCPHPEGYRKALRLMKVAELASVPIVTLIDTPGAFPGVASEERHIGEAIAVNLRDMFSLSVPVVSVVIGEGGSGGALGIGVGNQVLIMENAYYSVITPEGCAAILWKDRAYSEKAAEALHLTANDLKKLGIIDDVINEPLGGAHKDYEKAALLVKEAIVRSLDSLKGVSPEALKEQRYERFRNIAFYAEEKAEESAGTGENAAQ